MDWTSFGCCVIAVECALALAWTCRGVVRLLRKLPPSQLVALSLLAAGSTLVAQKTNSVPPNMNSPLPQMQQGGVFPQTGLTGLAGAGNLVNLANPVKNNICVQTTIDDIDRGWRVECVTTNAAVSYAMPTNAVGIGNWHLHGARSSFGNNFIDFGDWSFPLGANGAVFSSFWCFVDGRIRPAPRDAAHEICAIGVPMSAVPGRSRLWRLDGDDGSRTVAWECFFLGGDTNSQVDAQIVLCPNGDFVVRSNEVETVCRRIDPDDWDGDGLANAVDANPAECDGDFFGTCEAWYNGTLGHVLQASTNGAGETVATWLDPGDEGFYYWLSFSVTGRFETAAVSITCDGPSDLGDMTVVARAGEMAKVPLLVGADYSVESAMPFSFVGVSDANAQVQTNGATSLAVSYPLEWTLEKAVEPMTRLHLRSGGDGHSGSYRLRSTPFDVMAAVVGIAGGCCSIATNEYGVSWTCPGGCACCGMEHWLDVTAEWKGYSCTFSLFQSCPCATEDEDENGVAASIAFSAAAVVFEDVYTNAPGDVVARRSTTATLGGRIVGGNFGGTLAVTLSDGGRLACVGGALPTGATVPAGATFTFGVAYEGRAASAGEGDITATATFTENMTGRTVVDTASLTSVKVTVVADADWPLNKVRHVFGPKETFTITSNPQVSLYVEGSSFVSVNGNKVVAPDRAGPFSVDATICSMNTPMQFNCIAPEALQGGNPRGWENFEYAMLGVYPLFGGEPGVTMHLDMWLEPLYVSFSHVRIYEGYAPPVNRRGWYQDTVLFPDEWLEHGESAGAGVDSVNDSIGITDAGNLTDGGDFVAAFMFTTNTYYNGSYQLSIPVFWFAEDGLVTNQLPDNVQTAYVYSNGTMRVSKFGFTRERLIDGTEHQVED